MADTKISALPASTTPLAGTEVLPIVQGGATRQVSVANLTTGRALSATELTLTTGNLIVSNGQGIDFSATPGTGTSELLSDYEEGNWTPTVGGNATYNIQTGKYTKVGRTVTLTFDLEINVRGTGSQNTISGLPFSVVTTGAASICFWNGLATGMMYVSGIGSTTNILLTGSNSATTTLGYLPNILVDGARLQGQLIYFV